MRIDEHPVLGGRPAAQEVTITVDGEQLTAIAGEPIAAALLSHGRRTFRHTCGRNEPRGLFCGIGRCTDCIMTVDGVPNVRTCITPVRAGMVITSNCKEAADHGN